jgi:hypothetical protein
VSCTTEVFSRTVKLNPSRRCTLPSRQRTLLSDGWVIFGAVQKRQLTATATVKTQKKSHKSLKWIIVARPGERANKRKCQTGINEFLSSCPSNMWQYSPRTSLRPTGRTLQLYRIIFYFCLVSWDEVRLSPLGTSDTIWPIVPAPDCIWVWSSWWNEILQGRQELLGENLPQWHFVHLWPDLSSNPAGD